MSRITLKRPEMANALLLRAEALPPGRDPFDKLAENFLAIVQHASLRLWLRVYESTA